MLAWANKFCSQARYVVVTKEHTFVNWRRMEMLAEREMFSSNRVYGDFMYMMTPNRKVNGKHQVTSQEWPWQYYPPFSLGESLLVSSDALPRLLLSASLAPNLPVLPKVYLSGILPLVMDITTVQINNFFYSGKFFNISKSKQ